MGSGHGVLRGVGTEGEGVDTRAKTASDVMPRESLKVFKEGSNQMRFALKKNHCGKDLEAEQGWNI